MKITKRKINQYKQFRPFYKRYSEILQDILNRIVIEYIPKDKYIIIAKSLKVSKFGDIITSKKDILKPLEDLNKICKTIIVLPNLRLVETISKQLENSFKVLQDESNEEERIYIIKLRQNLTYYHAKFNLALPNWLIGMKARVKIRTFLYHSFKINKYLKFAKGELNLPDLYQKTFNDIQSILKTADKNIMNLLNEMQSYESIYSSYLTKEKISIELNRLLKIYDIYKMDLEFSYKVAKMAMIIKEWETAINILDDISKSAKFISLSNLKKSKIIGDLGISICKNSEPSEIAFENGLAILYNAIRLNKKDPNLFSSLGGAHKKKAEFFYKQGDINAGLQEDNIAKQLYKEALEIDPSDPYPLNNYLIYEILDKGDLTPLRMYRTEIQNAIDRRVEQIKVMVDTPWNFFDVALDKFFYSDFEDSIDNFLKAIRFSQEEWMISTTLRTINKLEVVKDKLEGFNLIRCVLMLGLGFQQILNNPDDSSILEDIISDLEKNEFNLKDTNDFFHGNFKRPIVIITGGSDDLIANKIQNYKTNLTSAFKDFEGTVICGGINSGIRKILGEIKKNNSERIKTVGYCPCRIHPTQMPNEDEIQLLHHTKGSDESVLEILRYWYDILRNKIVPSDVRVIGVNGGKINTLELRIAIAFGAKVGIFEDNIHEFELTRETKWEDRIEGDFVETPYRVYHILKNNHDDIEGFIRRPFIKDLDIDNLQLFILVRGGQMINPTYSVNFTLLDIDFLKLNLRTYNNYKVGLYDAYIEKIAPKDINYEKSIYSYTLKKDSKRGQIVDMLGLMNNFAESLTGHKIEKMKINQGYFIGKDFYNGDFKAVFFLKNKVSPRLSDKISKFISLLENQLCSSLLFSCEEKEKRFQQYEYPGGYPMRKIFAESFGKEIVMLVRNSDMMLFLMRVDNRRR